ARGGDWRPPPGGTVVIFAWWSILFGTRFKHWRASAPDWAPGSGDNPVPVARLARDACTRAFSLPGHPIPPKGPCHLWRGPAGRKSRRNGRRPGAAPGKTRRPASLDLLLLAVAHRDLRREAPRSDDRDVRVAMRISSAAWMSRSSSTNPGSSRAR